MSLSIIDLGLCSYAKALARQQEAVRAVRGGGQEQLILVEHDPPVITLGKGADAANVLAGADELGAAGIQLHETTRGGDVTYHGPGQLVGYPILDLSRRDRDVKAHLRRMEQMLIAALDAFEIEGFAREGLTGVWTAEGKIAALGIAVSRWVTYHGFALNVCPDLSHYQWIVPCGLADRRVVSMAGLLGRPLTAADVKPVVIECFRDEFNAATGDQ